MHNVLHVHQFYFIARHHGFNSAALHISYGITAHTLRQNLTSLEDDLGVKLVEREPVFRLLPAGQQLYDWARPFFAELDGVIDRLPGRAGKTLRVATSENIVREYVPEAMQFLEKKYPDTRFSFYGGTTAEIEAMVQAGEVDVGFTLVDRLPDGFQWERLLTLQLGLVVRKSSPISSAAPLFAPPVVHEKLVSPVPGSAVARAFQAELARRHCVWQPKCEVGSAWSIAKFVVGGSGIGVCVNVPALIKHPELRFVPLEGFPELTVAVLWRKDSGPLPAIVRDMLPQIRAHSVWRAAEKRGIPAKPVPVCE